MLSPALIKDKTHTHNSCVSIQGLHLSSLLNQNGPVFLLRHQLVPPSQPSPSNRAVDQKVLSLIKNAENTFYLTPVPFRGVFTLNEADITPLKECDLLK